MKVPFTFYSHLPINIGTWNTNLDIFQAFLGRWCHRGKSNFQKSQTSENFEIVISESNASPQISLYYWLSSFYRHWYMKYKFGSFLTQFWVNDLILQYFEKLVPETNSPHFKVSSNIDFDLSITLDTWYATFGPFLLNLEKMTSQKKCIFQNFEKLTLRTRSSVWYLKKMPVILLYWFAVQQQTSTCRRKKSRSIYSKFSVEQNEFTPSFQNPQEVA